MARSTVTLDVQPLGLRDPGDGWKERGRCADYAPDYALWDAIGFTDPSGSHAISPVTERVGLRVCLSCPVRSECLSYAIDLEEWTVPLALFDTHTGALVERTIGPMTLGRWGGTTYAERQALRHLPPAERLVALEEIALSRAPEVLTLAELEREHLEVRACA